MIQDLGQIDHLKSQSKSLLFLECRKQVPQADTDQRKCRTLININGKHLIVDRI